jgi:hypothetical protein
MSASGRRGRGRARPDAVGRWAAEGRPITPSARRSSVAVASVRARAGAQDRPAPARPPVTGLDIGCGTGRSLHA